MLFKITPIYFNSVSLMCLQNCICDSVCSSGLSNLSAISDDLEDFSKCFTMSKIWFSRISSSIRIQSAKISQLKLFSI